LGLSNAPYLTRVGTYDLLRRWGLGRNYAENVPSWTDDIHLSGAYVVALLKGVSGNEGVNAIEVVETGSPRYVTRGNVLQTAYTGTDALAARVRGSRLYALYDIDYQQIRLFDVSLRHLLAPATASADVTCSAKISAPDVCPSGAPFCTPLAIDRNYAYVGVEEGTSRANKIFDLAGTFGTCNDGGPGPVGRFVSNSRVTALAVSGSWLWASVWGTYSHAEAWNLHGGSVDPTHVVSASASAGYGQGIDAMENVAVVATDSGVRLVNTDASKVYSYASVGTFGGQPMEARHVWIDSTRIFTSVRQKAGSDTSQWHLAKYTWSPYTLNSAPSLAASVPLPAGAVPGFIQVTGQYLIMTISSTRSTQGVIAYDVSTTPPVLVGGSGGFANPYPQSFGIVGPYLLVPDGSRGVTLLRMY